MRELSEWMHDQGCADWSDMDLDRIASHLRSLDCRGLAVSTIARHVATIRVFCRFLKSHLLTRHDAAERLTQPTTWQTLPRVLRPSQVQALLAAPKPGQALYLRDVAMLELLYSSGLRASEATTLTVDRVHHDLAVVRVLGKGAKERIVPAGKPALDATRRYVAELRPRLLRTGHAQSRDRA